MRKITAEEFKRVEEQADLLAVLKITPFAEPKKRWMSETCKYYRKNEKFQGYSATGWNKLAETFR